MSGATASAAAARGGEHAALERFDVVVCGGGPAGLAVAIVAAERGFSALVLERHDLPPDKVCGEGLLPPAVMALERLGVMRHLPPESRRPFRGIRFIQEDQSAAEAPLPGTGGVGVRRTVLVEAMNRRARELGAAVRHRSPVSSVDRTRERAIVRTASGAVEARLVVAADGLHSPIRRAAGLERAPRKHRRYALRQHYRIRPWTDFVEVYVDERGEAFVTPVSNDIVNVNYVWQHGRFEHPTIETLGRRFPSLLARLSNAPSISPVRGAGPMNCAATRRTDERLLLIGDAAGFIDSISADGLSIALNSALLLGHELPAILGSGATRRSLAGYERGARRLFRSYWAVTTALLWIARHPRLRRGLIHQLERHPAGCRGMMRVAMHMMLSAVPAR